MVVGSAAGAAERRRRVDLLLAWARPDHSPRRRRIEALLYPASLRVPEIARVALRIHTSRRRAKVDELLRSLLGLSPDEGTAGDVAPSPAVVA
jgi:hypothetical protein